MIGAGKLDRRVELLQRVAGRDSIGQPQTTWQPLASVWANRKHVSGLETVRASADVSTVRGSYRIRYRADVSAAHRLQDGALIYDIKAVIPGDRNEFLDLVVEQVQ